MQLTSACVRWFVFCYVQFIFYYVQFVCQYIEITRKFVYVVLWIGGHPVHEGGKRLHVAASASSHSLDHLHVSAVPVVLYHDAKRIRPSQGGAPSIRQADTCYVLLLLPLAKQMAQPYTEQERKSSGRPGERAGERVCVIGKIMSMIRYRKTFAFV